MIIINIGNLMNAEKIKQRFFDGKDSDIELTIKDIDKNIIRLNLHRFVLLNSSNFFEALILFPDSNKNKYIEVPNIYIIRDIIASFYGINQNSTNYPEWQYILETLLCRNFLCLSIDVTQLYNLNVPPEGFELFFQTAQLFGDITLDRKLMRSIKRNLPSDYDKTIFSEDFLEELFRRNRLIVSGSNDHSIKIWDAETAECLETLIGHSDQVLSVAFSNDNKLIVSGGSDKNIIIWDFVTGKCLKVLHGYRDIPSSSSESETSKGHSGLVLSVAFSNDDNKLIVSAGTDWNIKIWDVETGKCVKTLRGHLNWVNSVVFSADNKLILSGSDDYMVKIWDVETGECLKSFDGHSAWVRFVSFSGDNELILSGSFSHTNGYQVKIWNAKSGECLRTFKRAYNKISAIFSGDDKLIFSCDSSKTIKIWNIETGECLEKKILKGDQSFPFPVVFSNDGKLIVSATHDNGIQIWNAKTGECSTIIDGHSNMVRSVAFSH